MPKTTEPMGMDTGGNYRSFRTDAMGGLMKAYYARDCMATGYAAVTLGGATIMPASSGSYTDIIMVSAATTSDKAVRVNLANGTTTVCDIVIPAASSVTLPFSHAIPANQIGHGWTASFALAGQGSVGTVATVFAVGIRNPR